MLLNETRRLQRRTPVYDHAGEFLFYASREKAQSLLENPHVNAGGTVKTVTSFRYSVDFADSSVNARSGRSTPAGLPHRSETYYNPAGVFTFDWIRPNMRVEFERVVRGAGAVTLRVPVERKFRVHIDECNVPGLPLVARSRAKVIEFPRRPDQAYREAA